MDTYKLKLVIITLILFIAGCEKQKDELTLPVRTHLKIYFIQPQEEYGYITFTEGQIGIQRIQFEGQREAGGDIFFETDPQTNLPALLFSSPPPVIVSDFDIPQGIYNSMKWNIELKRIVTDELTVNDDTDSLNTGFAIKGWYTYWIWSSDPEEFPIDVNIPFIVAIDDTEQFGFRSYDPDHNSRIVLSENKDYEAILSLNLPYAFAPISQESFEKADISGDSLHPRIIISRNENEELYNIILDRLAESSFVLIK
jgi:hypothetical protein